ncbi:MAG: hypothetical protein AB1331_05175 [Bacillota bacterium]
MQVKELAGVLKGLYLGSLRAFPARAVCWDCRLAATGTSVSTILSRHRWHRKENQGDHETEN